MNKIPVPVVYITSLILLVAAAPLPYGYYTLVRLVATVIFAWAAMVSYENKNSVLPYAFGLLVILFNPIIKVSFDKEIWAILDVAAAIFLLTTKRHIVQKNSN